MLYTREVGWGRWEVGGGKWEVGGGRWEVGGVTATHDFLSITLSCISVVTLWHEASHDWEVA